MTASWYRQLDLPARRMFWACFAGFALDAMDAQLFAFVIPSLKEDWGLDHRAIGILASATLVSSALGGWLAGLAADRFGRLPLLKITILWFAIFAGGAAFAQTYEQLLTLRILQGLGFGGEWTVGAILIAETVDAKVRGRATGMVQSGWAVGWGMAALTSTLALAFLPLELGWRVTFLIGLCPAFLVLLLRQGKLPLGEPRRTMEHVGWTRIFRRPWRGKTIMGCLFAVGIHGGYWTIATWLPAYLRTERHLSILDTGAYLGVVIVGSFIGYVAGAEASDRLGRRRTLLVFATGCVGIGLIFSKLQLSDVEMSLLGLPIGMFASGIFSIAGPVLTELYPTELRGSGQGFCYNFGRGAAGLFPIFVGFTFPSLSIAHAIGLFSLAAYGCVFIVALLLQETNNSRLASLNDAPSVCEPLCEGRPC